MRMRDSRLLRRQNPFRSKSRPFAPRPGTAAWCYRPNRPAFWFVDPRAAAPSATRGGLFPVREEAMRPALQALGKPALFAPLGRISSSPAGGPHLETLVRRAAPLVAVPEVTSARCGTSSLSGYVYADMDWIGERSNNDCALAGVAVTLTGTDVNGEDLT